MSEQLQARPKPQPAAASPAAAPPASALKPSKGRSTAARLSMRATAAASAERGPSKGSYARMPPRANEEKRWKRNDRFNATVRAAALFLPAAYKVQSIRDHFCVHQLSVPIAPVNQARAGITFISWLHRECPCPHPDSNWFQRFHYPFDERQIAIVGLRVVQSQVF